MKRSAWLAAMLVVALAVSPIPAQEPVKVKLGNLGFPSHSEIGRAHV